MRRSILQIVLLVLLAGCNYPTSALPAGSQTSPPAAIETTTPLPESPDAGPQPAETLQPQSSQPAGLIAYVTQDENIWILDRQTGETRQLTQDGQPFTGAESGPQARYCCAAWSADGALLAFQQEIFTQVESAFEARYALWVYDPAGDTSRPVLEDQLGIPGFAWRPGTHEITFAQAIPQNYFESRGNVHGGRGLASVDVDTGMVSDFVSPVRDYSIVRPVWSPDGRYVGFDEVVGMEGRGPFAYYDVEAQEYVPLDEAIGGYSWSLDGTLLAYDYMTYAANGSERVWIRPRLGGEAQPFSPEYDPGYSFNPVWSPQGDRLAYLAVIGSDDFDANSYTLYVQPYPPGEPRSLGVFEGVLNLNWSPDGSHLIFSSGPYDAPQIIEVNVDSGTAVILGDGSFPSWRP